MSSMVHPVLPSAAAATRHAVNITTRGGFQCRSRIQCGAHTLFDFEHPIAKAFATTGHGAACVSSSAKNAANAAAGFLYTQQLSLSDSVTFSRSPSHSLSVCVCVLLFPHLAPHCCSNCVAVICSAQWSISLDFAASLLASLVANKRQQPWQRQH